MGDTFSTVEAVQYSGGITSVKWGIALVLWRAFSTLGEDNISTVGDNIRTMESIQYSGGRFLISACLAIKNNEKISIFFVLRNEICIRKFQKFYKILRLFRAGLVYSRSNLVSK